MKRYYAIAILITLFASACTQKSKTEVQLNGVEYMLRDNYIDSAKVALIAIDPITEEDSAYYFILKAETDYRRRQEPSIDELNFSINYYERHIDDAKLANAYYYKACAYFFSDIMPNEVFAYLKKAEQLVEHTHDNILQYKVYSALTYANCAKNIKPEALKYAKKEYQAALKGACSRDIAYALIRLSTTYDQCGNQDSANFYIQKCATLIDEVDPKDKGFFYNLFGEYHLQQNVDSAMKYFEKALKFNTFSLPYKNIADIYYEKGDTGNWKMYCDSALIDAWYDTKSEILSDIADTYYDAEDIDGYRRTTDSIIKNLNDYHQYEKDNLALEIQKKFDFEKQQIEYEKNVWALLSIVLLLTVVCLLSVIISRRKIKHLEYVNADQYATIKNSESVIEEAESELDYLVKQNEEIMDKSENLATIVESNKRKIDSLQNEIEDQKVKYSKEVEIGKTIYNRILNIQSIASYKEQYANCLYYFEITFPEKAKMFSTYTNLTIENKIFIICDHDKLGFSDSEIAKILDIKESTVRSRRTKLKEKMA